MIATDYSPVARYQKFTPYFYFIYDLIEIALARFQLLLGFPSIFEEITFVIWK